jgi:adenosylmethionine-8-amino-7-oxononanoate aminotransferase
VEHARTDRGGQEISVASIHVDARLVRAHERVVPDIMILAKALTGWYLPLAITLVTEQIFSTFAASSEAEKTLHYGHSRTGNALACVASRASLEIFEKENVWDGLAGKIAALRSEFASLRELPWVADVRQCGFIAGVCADKVPA